MVVLLIIAALLAIAIPMFLAVPSAANDRAAVEPDERADRRQSPVPEESELQTAARSPPPRSALQQLR